MTGGEVCAVIHQAVVVGDPPEYCRVYESVGAEFAAVEVDVPDGTRGRAFVHNFNQENRNPGRLLAG